MTTLIAHTHTHAHTHMKENMQTHTQTYIQVLIFQQHEKSYHGARNCTLFAFGLNSPCQYTIATGGHKFAMAAR